MDSRDIKFLIVSRWFNVVHYSSYFQYFFRSTMVPTLFLFCACLLTFLEIIIMTGTHAYCIGWCCAPQSYHLKSEVFITFQICSIHYIVVWFNSWSKSSIIIKLTTTKKNAWFFVVKGSHHMPPLNWHILFSAKMNGTQSMFIKNALVYCSMRRGTSQAKATSKSP